MSDHVDVDICWYVIRYSNNFISIISSAALSPDAIENIEEYLYQASSYPEAVQFWQWYMSKQYNVLVRDTYVKLWRGGEKLTCKRNKTVLNYKYNSKFPVLYAHLESRVIGRIEYNLYNQKTVEIDLFWIEVRYRHQGYGRQLLEKFISICEKNDIYNIRLMTIDEYQSAIHLYLKVGFIVTENIGGCIYMEKILK